jgi:hypothetical protein
MVSWSSHNFLDEPEFQIDAGTLFQSFQNHTHANCPQRRVSLRDVGHFNLCWFRCHLCFFCRLVTLICYISSLVLSRLISLRKNGSGIFFLPLAGSVSRFAYSRARNVSWLWESLRRPRVKVVILGAWETLQSDSFGEISLRFPYLIKFQVILTLLCLIQLERSLKEFIRTRSYRNENFVESEINSHERW